MRTMAPAYPFAYEHVAEPEFDRAYAALLEDLHQRGLLDSTLVLS